MPQTPDDRSTVSTAEAFRIELQRLQANREGSPPGGRDASGYNAGLELGPATVHEAVTRQMVESLAADIREIKGRINNLLFMLIGGSCSRSRSGWAARCSRRW